MLTERNLAEDGAAASHLIDTTGPASDERTSAIRSSFLQSAFSLEWLGQTLASVCWIASVFTYGISSAGDWLQLFAASAWFVANMTTLFSKRG
ncbi:MAG: hypothetical protein AAF456_04700 [Planctomycetota bacterium]